mmetsp:Transcript_81775/g.226538  ORF Transcript_81775/g.226538 Transcript_81775/m.226538 type:complete len:355 (+) Transcript_81775:206-1270(+)
MIAPLQSPASSFDLPRSQSAGASNGARKSRSLTSERSAKAPGRPGFKRQASVRSSRASVRWPWRSKALPRPAQASAWRRSRLMVLLHVSLAASHKPCSSSASARRSKDSTSSSSSRNGGGAGGGSTAATAASAASSSQVESTPSEASDASPGSGRASCLTARAAAPLLPPPLPTWRGPSAGAACAAAGAGLGGAAAGRGPSASGSGAPEATATLLNASISEGPAAVGTASWSFIDGSSTGSSCSLDSSTAEATLVSNAMCGGVPTVSVVEASPAEADARSSAGAVPLPLLALASLVPPPTAIAPAAAVLALLAVTATEAVVAALAPAAAMPAVVASEPRCDLGRRLRGRPAAER